MEAKAAGILPTPVVTASSAEKAQPMVIGGAEIGETQTPAAIATTASSAEKPELVVVGAVQT